ncbi:MAG: hypothetical protein WC861_06530 [Candidatus Micrarchaeia archaeon]|jgi:hypothetical protein
MSMIIRKPLMGIMLGAGAGIIDILPMLAYDLPFESQLSAFSLWVISGFLIAIVNIPVIGAPKGVLIAALVLTPSAILIGAAEPMSLVPVAAMTLLMGSCLGYMIDKYRETRRGL